MSNSGGDVPAHTRCIFEEAVRIRWRVHRGASASDALVGFVVPDGVFNNFTVLIKIALAVLDQVVDLTVMLDPASFVDLGLADFLNVNVLQGMVSFL